MPKPLHRISEITERPAARGQSRSLVRKPRATLDDARLREIEHGPLGERLGYILRRAQIAIFEDFIAACARYDIRPAQYSMLTIIEQNPGLSQTRVAESLGIKKPNFVAMVDAFERRGLLRRAATPGDRRSYALTLTDEGKTLLRKLHRVAERHEARIVERIGPLMHKRMFSALASIATMSTDTGRED